MKNAIFVLLTTMVCFLIGANAYSIKGGHCGRLSRSCKASCRPHPGNETISVAPLGHTTDLAPNPTTISANTTTHLLTGAPTPSILSTNAPSAVTTISSPTLVGVSSTLDILPSSNTNSLSSPTPTHLASTSKGYRTNPLPTAVFSTVVLLVLWGYV